MNEMKELGKKIRELRKKQNISADDLAKKLGKEGGNKRQFLYDIEKGRVKKINLKILEDLAKELSVSSSEFLDLTSKSQVYFEESYLQKKSKKNATLHEKYTKLLEENSKLKSQIIDLYEKLVKSNQ